MIKEILKSLTLEERKQLMYAFENEFTQYIDLPNNKFIGVNIQSIKCLEILESKGVWSYGKKNKEAV